MPPQIPNNPSKHFYYTGERVRLTLPAIYEYCRMNKRTTLSKKELAEVFTVHEYKVQWIRIKHSSGIIILVCLLNGLRLQTIGIRCMLILPLSSQEHGNLMNRTDSLRVRRPQGVTESKNPLGAGLGAVCINRDKTVMNRNIRLPYSAH